MKLTSLTDTRDLARAILRHCPAASLVLLSGDLSSGKTTLTQQLAAELGSSAHVSSPTYTLIHEYPTPEGILVHIDAYRLPTAEALFELGLEDYLERARLVVIEWGEKLLEHYPDALLVKLELDEQGRRAHLRLPDQP